MPPSWSDALEALGRDNPLSRLPHLESVARFEQRLAAGQLDFLSFEVPCQVDGQGATLSASVERAFLCDPGSEAVARSGRDDLVRLVALDVVARVGGNPITRLRFQGSLPHPTLRGTLLRCRRGAASEWAPLGQLLPAPGVHFVAPSLLSGATVEWTDRRVYIWPEHGAPVRIFATRGRHEVTVSVGRESWKLASLAPADGGPPLNRKPFPPFLTSPGFVLGAHARADLDARLSERLGASQLAELRAQHDPEGVVDRDRHLCASDLLACARELGRDPDQTERWRDDPGDLSKRRVLLLGDYFDLALRRGIAVVRRLLETQPPGARPKLADTPAAFREGLRSSLKGLWRWRTEYHDDTNPLAALSAGRKVTYCGPSGVNPGQMLRELRDLHLSHHGRLCAIESPESDRVGLSLFLASHARVDARGRIVTPLLEGGRAVERAAREDLHRAVAAHPGYAVAQEDSGCSSEVPSRLPESAGTALTRRLGRAAAGFTQDELQWQSAGSLEWSDAQPGQGLGAGASLIPFVGHDDGARAMMGAKNMKQAVPVVAPYPPLVCTGFERLIGQASPLNIHSPLDGKVTRLDEHHMIVAGEGRWRSVELRRTAGQHGTDQSYLACVRHGDAVRRGQVLAWGPGSEGGELALGRNLLVAYLPWLGWNFEDGIVASRRLLDDDVLTSTWCHTFVVRVWADGRVGGERPELAPAGAVTTGGAEVWVAPVGTRVRAGDDLVRAQRGTFRVPVGVDATVRRVRHVRLEYGHDTSSENPAQAVHVSVEQRRPVAVGDKLMGRHGNKGVVSRILEPGEMPKLRVHGQDLPVDLLLNPLGVVSRMNVGQLLETHLGLLAWLRGAGQPLLHPDLGPDRVRFTVPPFSTVAEDWLKEQLAQVGFPEGKAGEGGTALIDPATGRPFPAPVTVGVQYFLKLNHYATDKLAIRGKGPSYSGELRQAARGRAVRGGQRFGEMEGWALQGYGTPHLLRELIRDKGDDVRAREQGEPSLPEAFRVVTVYLRGLGVETELRLRGEEQWRGGFHYKARLDPEDVEEVRLRWARAGEVREWSHGAVTKPGTAYQRVPAAPLYRCEKCDEEVTKRQWWGRSHRAPCGGRLSKKALPSLWRPRPGGLLCREIFGGREPEGRTLGVSQEALLPDSALQRAWPSAADLDTVAWGATSVVCASGTTPRQVGELVWPDELSALAARGATWGTGQSAVKAVCLGLKARAVSEAHRRLGPRFAPLRSVLLEDRYVVIEMPPAGADGDVRPGRNVPEAEVTQALAAEPQAPRWQGARIATGIGAVRSVLEARGHSAAAVAKLLGSPPVSAPADPKGYRDRFGHIDLTEEVVHPWFLDLSDSPLRRGWPTLPDLQTVLEQQCSVVVDPGPSNRMPGERVPGRDVAALEAQGVRVATGPGAVDLLVNRLSALSRAQAWSILRGRFAPLRSVLELRVAVVTDPGGSELRVGQRRPRQRRPHAADLALVAAGEQDVLIDPGSSDGVAGQRVEAGEREALRRQGALFGSGPQGVQLVLEALGLDAETAPAAIGRACRAAAGAIRGPATSGTGIAAVREVLRARGIDPATVAPAFLRRLPVIPGAFRDHDTARFPAKETLPGRYTRVLHWNHELALARQDGAPQDRCDELYRRLCRAVARLLGTSERSKGSLSGALSGKTGLLRRPLLGKRADFSSRGVIVPDPQLALDEVSLPGEMFDQLRAAVGDEVGKPLVLLNRAPSLHRYNIQSVRAVRRMDQAIGLHPLNCAGLNADFDGDTVAIHVPRSPEAIREAEALLPSRNLLSVANGAPLLHLALDIVAGLFVASTSRKGLTPGLPPGLGSGPITKRALSGKIQDLARSDPARAARLAEEAMRVGFEHATRAGLSLGLWDILEQQDPEVRRLAREKMESGDVAAGWVDLVTGYAVHASGAKTNPLAVYFASGARGAARQLGQLGALRGRMEGCDGRPLPFFVESSLRRGLHPHEFFLCAHGTRKAMFEKKMVTGQSGGLTRWLAEGCSIATVSQHDCAADGERPDGLLVLPKDFGWSWPVLWGRTLLADDSSIDEAKLAQLEKAGLPVTIRSPLHCHAWPDVCQRCYGLDPSSGHPAELGLAVGILAAQSIGERGTQLTMRTFHGGGGAGSTALPIEKARKLFLEPPPTFLDFLKQAEVYEGAVDLRHFEVVYSRLAWPGARTETRGSIKGAAVADPRRHWLARASAYDVPAAVLAAELWGDVAEGWESPGSPTWRIEHGKERMLLGPLFREVAR
jgi:DNA-directed RNA polymerase beta subunit/DNA-directed RNA polymerase beta' subunit